MFAKNVTNIFQCQILNVGPNTTALTCKASLGKKLDTNTKWWQ